MKDALEIAIKAATEKSAKATSPDDAMKYAQAALNLTNALIGLSDIEIE